MVGSEVPEAGPPGPAFERVCSITLQEDEHGELTREEQYLPKNMPPQSLP